MNIASQPYQRGIYCQDESISYPLRPDTISHVTMAVVTITCTIIIVSPSFIDISIIPSMISSSHESRADSQQSVRSWLCTAERFIMHNNTALCARGRVWHIYNTPNCFNLCRYRNAYFFCSFRYLQVKHTWCTAKRFTPTLPLINMCQPYIRCWVPSCLGEPSANHWRTWPSTPLGDHVHIS